MAATAGVATGATVALVGAGLPAAAAAGRHSCLNLGVFSILVLYQLRRFAGSKLYKGSIHRSKSRCNVRSIADKAASYAVGQEAPSITYRKYARVRRSQCSFHSLLTGVGGAVAVAADTPAMMKKAGTGNTDKQQVVIEKAEVPNTPYITDMTLETSCAA